LERGKSCARVVDVHPVRSAAGPLRTASAAGAAKLKKKPLAVQGINRKWAACIDGFVAVEYAKSLNSV